MAGIEIYATRLPRHRRTWTAAAIPLAVVFILTGQILTALLARLFGIDVLNRTPTWPQTAATLFGFGLIVLVLWVWLRLFERRGLKEIGFNGWWWVRYGRGLLFGCLFLAAVVGLISLLGGYAIQGPGVWSALSPMAALPLIVLAGGFMVQGATEETLMRGWLMQLVASRHGVIWAIIINMLLFSLLHAGNIIPPTKELLLGLANIVLVAIFLSLYALHEGSLVGVCGWHAAWNWLLGVGFGLEVSGQRIQAAPLIIDLMDKTGAPWWLTGGAFGPEASVMTSGVLSAGLVWLVARRAWRAQPYPILATEVAALKSDK